MLNLEKTIEHLSNMSSKQRRMYNKPPLFIYFFFALTPTKELGARLIPVYPNMGSIPPPPLG